MALDRFIIVIGFGASFGIVVGLTQETERQTIVNYQEKKVMLETVTYFLPDGQPIDFLKVPKGKVKIRVGAVNSGYTYKKVFSKHGFITSCTSEVDSFLIAKFPLSVSLYNAITELPQVWIPLEKKDGKPNQLLRIGSFLKVGEISVRLSKFWQVDTRPPSYCEFIAAVMVGKAEYEYTAFADYFGAKKKPDTPMSWDVPSAILPDHLLKPSNKNPNIPFHRQGNDIGFLDKIAIRYGKCNEWGLVGFQGIVEGFLLDSPHRLFVLEDHRKAYWHTLGTGSAVWRYAGAKKDDKKVIEQGKQIGIFDAEAIGASQPARICKIGWSDTFYYTVWGSPGYDEVRAAKGSTSYCFCNVDSDSFIEHEWNWRGVRLAIAPIKINGEVAPSLVNA